MKLLPFGVIVAALTATAAAQIPVEVRLLDQSGTEISGSFIQVGPVAYTTGSTIDLPAGSTNFVLQPALPQLSGTSRIARTEVVEVTASTTTLDFEWVMVDVAMNLNDQFGAPLPGSRLQLYPGGSPRVFNGTTLRLPVNDPVVYPTVFSATWPTGYTVSLDATPGPSSGKLLRFDSGVIVSPPTTSLDFEWITVPVELSVVDQVGALAPGALIQVYQSGPSTPNGGTLVLPINDIAVYSTINTNGAWGGGYDFLLDISPGAGFSRLYRLDSDYLVSTTTTGLDFEWRTSAVELRIVDQNGVLIPDAVVQPYPSGPKTVNGGTLVLPVTDRTLYPTISLNSWGDGYDFLLDVTPGVNGSAVVRLENEVDILEATDMIEFEWIRVDCPLTLLDANLVPVPGSAILFPTGFPAFAIGDTITLPITDNGVYPQISSVYRDGYPITVRPGDQAGQSSAIQLEVLEDGLLDPNTIDVNGTTYHLSCASNQPPTADAGDNVTITSAEQSTTTIPGSAADVDGDPLTYRWLEGAVELLAATPVAANGDAPLDLGLLASLGVGTHVLTLEVSDAEITVTDTMVLTIGNSPPDVACSGSGTYEFVVDSVALGATVSDFDGDLLSYSWDLGGFVLGGGVVQASAGGSPIAIPATTVPTGAAPGQIPFGQSAIVLTVQDAAGASSQCSVEVVVVDSEAPTLAPVSNVAMLWPPNHQMVDVTIDANATDSSGQPVTLSAIVQSSENARKRGSGQTDPDFTEPVINQATGQITLQLRAERSGKGKGRVYTIVITATDAAGNASVAEVEVVAAHDRRGN